MIKHPVTLLVSEDKQKRLAVAKQFAKERLCKNKGCGQCSICSRIDREIHPDVIVIKSYEEDVLKIDLVREICEQMALSPLESEAKVCIIDDCHRLHFTAQNAFLKTLEEPIPNRYFWLLTHKVDSLLPTLISRSVQQRLQPNANIPIEYEAQSKILWENFLQTRDSKLLSAQITDKERASTFIQYLKKRCREKTLRFEEEAQDNTELLKDFDTLQLIESRLRSNANYGLMLETYLNHLTGV